MHKNLNIIISLSHQFLELWTQIKSHRWLNYTNNICETQQ